MGAPDLILREAGADTRRIDPRGQAGLPGVADLVVLGENPDGSLSWP